MARTAFSLELMIEHWGKPGSGSTLWDVPESVKPSHRVQTEEPRVVPTDHKINIARIVLQFRQMGVLVVSEPHVVGG